MASIDEFPDDPKYTIKTVCAQTGIRPVTLRAWERRHEVLNPYRSDNRYRLYSERDVATLRWVKNRVDSGVSISNAVHELHSMQKNGVSPEAIPSAPLAAITATPGTPPDRYARELFQALLKHDEALAGDLLHEAHAIFDLMTIFTQVLYPALVDIGEAWYRGEIRVTTEHFASSFIRGRLLSLMQAYPSRRNAPYILVGCAPTEQHEIGSLMIAVLLRSNGYRVEYLGPDIPLDDLVDYAAYEHPTLICLSATSGSAAEELVGLQERLNKLRPPVNFGYGGRAFNVKSDLRAKVSGAFLGETLPDSMTTIKGLLTRHR
jgi:MerR family transcriptional regulator, light-induced transcriptional regulator